MILVVGRPDDPHTRLVMDALAKRGAAQAWLDTGAFITGCRFSLRQEGPRWSGRIDTSDGAIDLETVKSVWYRRIRAMEPPPDIGREDQRLALEEGMHILDGLWRVLED